MESKKNQGQQGDSKRHIEHGEKRGGYRPNVGSIDRDNPPRPNKPSVKPSKQD